MSDTVTDQRPHTHDMVRPRDDRVVAGVASGIARRLGVGPGWVRIAFILLLFFGGLGLLAYGVGWLAIREEGATESVLDDWLDGLEGSTAWIGAGLVVLAGMILLSATDVISGNLVFAAGLFLAGVLLYRGRFPTRTAPVDPSSTDPSTTDPSPTGPPVDPGPVVAALDGTVTAPTAALPAPGEGSPEDVIGDGPGGGGWGPPGPPPSPAVVAEPVPAVPPRPPSYLGRLTVAAGLVTIGTMAAFDNLDLASPGLRHYVAALVLVTGIGLLIGAFAGRARGLIVLGFILLPLMLAASAVRIDIFGEYADQTVRPGAIVDLDPSYELSGGELVLDLRALDATDFDADAAPVAVAASVGMGELEVLLPPGIDVEISSEVGIGRLAIDPPGGPTIEHGGFGLEESFASGTGEPDLLLDLEVGAGNLEIDLR